MTDFFKLTEKLFPSQRVETGATRLEQTNLIATAVSDSTDGYVEVQMPGPVTYPEDSDQSSVLIPTGPAVKEGDQVHISLNGGVGKSPVIVNAAGWGDRVSDVANEAAEVANAINQHFWTDDTGAHVTDVTQDEWHEAEDDDFSDLSDSKPYHNSLWNSLGMLFRSALNNLVSITRSAIAFYNGEGNTSTDIVAQFGKDGFQVGMTDESHLIGDYHSLQLRDKEGNTYFHISDLRNTEGYATFEEIVTAPAGQSYIIVSFPVHEVLSMVGEGRISGTPHAQDLSDRIDIYPTPERAESIAVTYTTGAVQAKAYTLGLRDNQGTIGAMSVAEGRSCIASGSYSHAEGSGSLAFGSVSHASGSSSKAYGPFSYAEGASCTAGYLMNGRGYGEATHAEGGFTYATPNYSHAQNYYTKANSACSTAMGKYNIGRTTTALEVGNGTGTGSASSNAFEVYWDGDIKAGKDVIDGYGNKLSDFANARSDLIKTVSGTTYNITSSQTSGSISVQIPSGYKFICWVQPRTNGWVGMPYVGAWSVSGQTATANLWWTNQFWSGTSNSISVEALCLYVGT